MKAKIHFEGDFILDYRGPQPILQIDEDAVTIIINALLEHDVIDIQNIKAKAEIVEE